MLSEWLNHPAVQSGIAPFIAALITAELLNRLRLSGLAVIAGFAATVYLAADFNFESLSAIKKIILAGLIAAAIAPLFDLVADGWRFLRFLIAAACGGVVLWVLWPVLQQKEMQEAAMIGTGVVAYAMWLAIFMDRLTARSVHAGAAGMSLGIGGYPAQRSWPIR